MPTSATGSSRRGRSDGFTLVELLVVLAIVGLMSAAVVLAMPDPRGSLAGEAERFAARARALHEQSILGAETLSIRVTSAGYSFDRRGEEDWQPIGRSPFVDYGWGRGIEARVDGEEEARIAFNPTGDADPAELLLSRGAEQARVTVGHDGAISVRR